MNDKHGRIFTPTDLKENDLSKKGEKDFASGTYGIPNLSSLKNLCRDDSSEKEFKDVDDSEKGSYDILLKKFFEMEERNFELREKEVKIKDQNFELREKEVKIKEQNFELQKKVSFFVILKIIVNIIPTIIIIWHLLLPPSLHFLPLKQTEAIQQQD